MTRGKKTCKILKEIRQQIADKNDIAYITSECTFQGECKGTCPKCEEELRYLENELQKRKQLGKAAIVAGVSLGIAGSFATMPNASIYGQDLMIEKTMQDDTVATTIVIKNVATVEGKMIRMVERFGGIEITISPIFPGGEEARLNYLKENLKYPVSARDSNIQGTVYVSFAVEKDGRISDVKVMRGIGGGCDEEAVRVVKMMPKWKPAEQGGKIIKYEYTLPIEFSLER